MQTLRSLIFRQARGTNSIEFFFTLGPVLFLTLAFAQFYFLAQSVYFESTQQYGQAFEDAYEGDHEDDLDDNMGAQDLFCRVYIIPMFRPFLGGGAYWNWQPYGSGYQSAGSFEVAGGSQGEWWDVVDAALGFPGLAYQYIDFPWSQISLSGVGAPESSGELGLPDADDSDGWGDVLDQAEDSANEASEEGEEEAQEQAEDACSGFADYRDDMYSYWQTADMCDDAWIWDQARDDDNNPLWDELDEDGNPTGNKVTVSSGNGYNFPESIPPERATCISTGWGSQNAAAADKDEAWAGYQDAQNQGSEAGCW